MADKVAMHKNDGMDDSIITIGMHDTARSLPDDRTVQATWPRSFKVGLRSAGPQRFITLVVLSLISFSTLIALLKRIYEGDTALLQPPEASLQHPNDTMILSNVTNNLF